MHWYVSIMHTLIAELFHESQTDSPRRSLNTQTMPIIQQTGVRWHYQSMHTVR